MLVSYFFRKQHPTRPFGCRHFSLCLVHTNEAGRPVLERWGPQGVINRLEAFSSSYSVAGLPSVASGPDEQTHSGWGSKSIPTSEVENTHTHTHILPIQYTYTHIQQPRWAIFLTAWPESSCPLSVLLELTKWTKNGGWSIQLHYSWT